MSDGTTQIIVGYTAQQHDCPHAGADQEELQMLKAQALELSARANK